MALHVEPAGVARQRSARSDDAMARQHDRDRVSVHHRADGARRARAPGLRWRARRRSSSRRRERAPARAARRAWNGATRRSSGRSKSRRSPSKYSSSSRRTSSSGERRSRAPKSRASELSAVLGRVRDAADAAVGRGDEERPDRRVDDVVADVDESLANCRRAEPRVELRRDVHVSSSVCGRRTMPRRAQRPRTSRARRRSGRRGGRSRSGARRPHARSAAGRPVRCSSSRNASRSQLDRPARAVVEPVAASRAARPSQRSSRS